MPRDDIERTTVTPDARDVDHLWQGNRAIEALDPTSFGIDERSVADTLQFAAELADVITYVTPDGTLVRPGEGPGWAQFFKDDPSFLIARLLGYKPVSSVKSNWLFLRDWYLNAKRVTARLPPSSLVEGLGAILAAAGQVPESGLGDAPLVLIDATQPLSIDWDGISVSDADVVNVQSVIQTLQAKAQDVFERTLTQEANHPPQTGLYVAFAQVLQTTRIALNELTNRHLEFYYRTVLQEMPAGAVADHAYLSLDIGAGAAPVRLEAGHVFLGPQGGNGVASQFALDDAAIFAPVRLTAIDKLSLSVDFSGRINGLWTQNIPTTSAPEGWDLFTPDRDTSTTQAADSGFLVASASLALSGGQRQIDLVLSLNDPNGNGLAGALDKMVFDLAVRADRAMDDPLNVAELHTAISQFYSAQVSTAKGALNASSVTVHSVDRNAETITLRVTLDHSEPALAVDPNSGVADPWVRISLAQDVGYFGYNPLGRFIIEDVKLFVAVSGLAGQTGSGKGKPVPADGTPPFGPVPAPGARLDVSHPDLDGRQIDDLGLSWGWTGLPAAPSDLTSHYAPYGKEIANDSFRATASLYQSGSWQDARPSNRVFDHDVGGVPIFAMGDSDAMTDTVNLTFDTNGASDGVRGVRLTWTAPSMGMGQSIYPQILADAVLAKTKSTGIINKFLHAFGLRKPVVTPLPPVVVKLVDLTLSFTSHAAVSTGSAQLLQFGPLIPLQQVRQCALSPLPLADRGLVRLTLTGADAGGAVNLLIYTLDTDHARAMAARPKHKQQQIDINWVYQSTQGWKDIPQNNIVSDGTGLIAATGVVQMILPQDVALDDAGTVQIGLSAAAGAQASCRVRSILTGGARVTRVLTDTDQVTAPIVAAGQIKGSALPIASLSKINQPEPSIGGRAAETTDAFRLRLSDRLRTKGRAITPRDYETLVLDNCPDIAEAKCLPSGRMGSAVGPVTIVVTPLAGRDTPQSYPSVPLARRREIADMLAVRSAQWDQNIQIINPTYEPVQLQAWLALEAGATKRDVFAAVVAAFEEIVCPWRNAQVAPMQIGTGWLDAQAIAAQLDQVPGVSRMTGVSFVQTYVAPSANGTADFHGLKDTAQATRTAGEVGGFINASAPQSVLVPATHHRISLLNTERSIGTLAVARDLFSPSRAQAQFWEQDPSLMPRAPTPFGIGAMEIGATFIPTTRSDATPPELGAPAALAGIAPAPFAVLPPDTPPSSVRKASL